MLTSPVEQTRETGPSGRRGFVSGNKDLPEELLHADRDDSSSLPAFSEKQSHEGAKHCQSPTKTLGAERT